jgi:hypothetical protein
MRTNETALGLDVGTSRIVKAERAGDEYKYSSELNAFVTIPFSKITAGVLEREGIPHSVDNGEIVVQGNESEKFADLMNAEIRRTMTSGVLDAREPESLNQIGRLIESLVGKGKGTKLCFTVPAAPLGHEKNLTYHEATLKQVLGDLGYQAKAINEGQAVVYGELESTNFTGIGISCGGGLCNVCVSYLSVPVMSFSVPKAGDYIDNSAASITGERANRIRIEKEQSFHFNGHYADKVHQVINVYYDDMIRTLVTGLREAFANSRNLPKMNRPVPVVLSGGTALPKGFRDRFESILREQTFPVQISEIRMAANPLHSTAKGALIAALSD